MSAPADDCTHCQEWEICPFHPAPMAVTPAPPRAQADLTLGGIPLHVTSVPPCIAVAPALPTVAGARLLGLDDPEVSADLIYAVPGGGVMGVPQTSNTLIVAAIQAQVKALQATGLLNPGTFNVKPDPINGFVVTMLQEVHEIVARVKVSR